MPWAPAQEGSGSAVLHRILMWSIFLDFSRLLTSLPWAVLLPGRLEFIKLLVIWWNGLFLRSGALHLVESTAVSLSLPISLLCITLPVAFPSPSFLPPGPVPPKWPLSMRER